MKFEDATVLPRDSLNIAMSSCYVTFKILLAFGMPAVNIL
jgi:hypothetical protein